MRMQRYAHNGSRSTLEVAEFDDETASRHLQQAALARVASDRRDQERRDWEKAPASIRSSEKPEMLFAGPHWTYLSPNNTDLEVGTYQWNIDEAKWIPITVSDQVAIGL